MNLIGPLLAGIRGAENGTAELYQRGTSTRATWYATFEGEGGNSTGASITLDANGSAEVYVDELVDIIVKDSSGNTVRSFTAGHSAPVVEVRSQSFTGTDYVTAQQAAGNPTTLQRVLDLWLTSAGNKGTDFGVQLDGVRELLVDAISRVAGPPFFNVKDTNYGAVGDGTTDDTLAITAAINAAVAAGGGIVWFPAGFYLLTSALSIPKEVSLWGPTGGLATTGAAELIQSTVAQAVLTFPAGGATGVREVHGLRMRHSAASTTAVITSTVGSDTPTHFVACHFGSTNDNATAVVTAGNATFLRCVFDVGTNGGGPATGVALASAANAKLLVVRDCLFRAPAVTYNPAAPMILPTATFVHVSGCRFDMSAMTAGTAYAMGTGVSTSTTVYLGNFISDPTGGTAYMFVLQATEATRFYEDCNFTDPAGGSASLYTVVIITGNATPDWRGFHLGSRERRQFYISDNSANLQLNALEYGTIFLERTSNAVQTLTTNFVLPNGSFTLVVKNTIGGVSGNITQSAASFRPARTFTINDTLHDVSRFRGVGVATPLWFSDSTPQNNI